MSEELRVTLYKTLENEMRKNEKIVTIGADLDKSDGFFGLRDEFPERSFSAGIAEQDMTCIAAGMASQGFIPFINTFCPFATRRICDQIAISLCYADSNVKIIGTDPGIAAELNGGTHMTFEDIGVVRSIPNIRIVEPTDNIELAQMIPAIAAIKGPVYLRMYRKLIASVHTDDYKYKFGEADLLREGNDLSIIASGIMVCEALTAAAELAAAGIDAEVINLHTIKPIDKDAILKTAQKTNLIVTAENHNVLGGLRSAVAEVVTEHYPVKIYPVGVNDIKGEVGKLPYLREQFGLTAENIVKTARKAVSEK